MAKAILTKKSLVLKYQKGVDNNGDPKFSTQKFSKIRVDAEDSKLYEVGEALTALLASDVNFVLKEDDFKFEEAAPEI
ncbi:DUF1659 domain-containing protein [Clostridium sp. LIBA-8841]|uniref:DUF1659 domain-containing protein n=1 Tax=Clostridium sp. LIBA-8841 TaxID=2987530 RepID=UPI002AC4621D|nr:DUF1659 domain-containing protein [Clostridium sp. LIBA-8841]MDZ5255141.1 DUF1659 domain-containing protein [Clostridium sp. LIBA-8841]